MNKRLEQIKEEVKTLHDTSSDECMKKWFYNGHVRLVAKYAEEISEKVKANTEIAILASLFHDIARTWNVNDDPALMDESLIKAEEIMQKYNYTNDEINQVKQAILSHGCHEKAPETIEGKVMATADALAHLLSDFYFILPFYGWLKAANTFDGYRSWLLAKIERDMHKKIFFEEYKKIAQPKYEALKIVFTSSID